MASFTLELPKEFVEVLVKPVFLEENGSKVGELRKDYLSQTQHFQNNFSMKHVQS